MFKICILFKTVLNLACTIFLVVMFKSSLIFKLYWLQFYQNPFRRLLTMKEGQYFLLLCLNMESMHFSLTYIQMNIFCTLVVGFPLQPMFRVG